MLYKEAYLVQRWCVEEGLFEPFSKLKACSMHSGTTNRDFSVSIKLNLKKEEGTFLSEAVYRTIPSCVSDGTLPESYRKQVLLGYLLKSLAENS